MPELSAGPRFACWFAAYLVGRTSLDDALDAITSDGATHYLAGLQGDAVVGADVDEEAPTPLVLGLGRLRAAGVVHVCLALPVSGDPTGLAGPPDFNILAIEAGEAVLLGGAGLGLVPAAVGSTVVWRLGTAVAPAPLDITEADRGLRAAVGESADSLAALDVAQWHPEVADALLNLRHAGALDLPPGIDPNAVALAGMATRCRRIVELARQTSGAAVSADEADARLQALKPLDRAARRGLAAACSSALPR
ncbi:MAG: hypothetical protein ACRDOY_04310 [Nocardioidaceae bacterium]